MLYAAIGIGSNSTRCLVGSIENGTVTPLTRMREGTRLFNGLSEGVLSQESILRTAWAVSRFVQTVREMGCESIRLIGTSAARDALNGDELCELVESVCGIPLTIISGEEEARLSFLGCAGNGYCGLVDIGGGSTELAVGGGGRPFQAASAQLGAARLLYEIADLSGEGLSRAQTLARGRIGAEIHQMHITQPPAAWFGVGGTLTCLASIDMGLSTYDREAVDGHALKKSAVERWAQKLSAMSPKDRQAIPGMQPNRADIIAHGAVLLLGAMEALKIARIVVCNRSNLDGCLQEIAGEQRNADSVNKVRAYYDASVEQEWARLERHYFEFEINKAYIDRYVKPGYRVLDAGGGPGRYSLHLAARGAEVTLLDLSPGNVAFAQEKSAEAGLSLQTVCADACFLDVAVDGEFDAILLMGPLYHLLEEADRVRAVEACLARLKPGGILFAAFISTTAGMIYAGSRLPESIAWEGEDMFYEKIIAGEDYAGAAFTQAFFIAPNHIAPFMKRFPLDMLHIVGSEGISAPFGVLAEQTPEVTAKWLALSMALCEREDFIHYSEHILYIGRKRI